MTDVIARNTCLRTRVQIEGCIDPLHSESCTHNSFVLLIGPILDFYAVVFYRYACPEYWNSMVAKWTVQAVVINSIQSQSEQKEHKGKPMLRIADYLHFVWNRYAYMEFTSQGHHRSKIRIFFRRCWLIPTKIAIPVSFFYFRFIW